MMIPEMTDRLGQFWDQPSRDEILVDDEVAMMTEQTRRELPHYETSIPTGVYNGKMWRRGDLLMWYGDSPDPNKCSINTRKIVII